MKIIFTTIPMKGKLSALKYPVPENKNIEYEKPVLFPVNAVLAKTIATGEKVKVIMLMNEVGHSKENAQKFENELREINKSIDANLEFHSVSADFVETKTTHELRFRKLLDFVEQDAEIITDITFGQKTLPIVLFCTLNFAEKFFDCDIKYIVYGKVEFENDKPKDGTQCLYDLTSLYYLNALTSAMEAPDGKSAIKILDNFFSL